ncbi:MAG: chorismate mutase [Patescibacteria group bacterium]|jgi:chorismate mutase
MERTLESIGVEIDEIDALFVRLLALRFRLALEAGEIKRAAGLPIVRPAVEQARIAAVTKLAEAQGLPDDFVRELMEKIVFRCRTAQKLPPPTRTGWAACS